MTVFALLGATALWLLFAWLASAIIASYLSERKGYGQRAGARLRPAAQRHRDHHLAHHPGEAGVAVEEGRPVGPDRQEPPPAA